MTWSAAWTTAPKKSTAAIARDVAAEPGAGDRRCPDDERARSEAPRPDPLARCERSGDADPSEVLSDDEPDDEEHPERELVEREEAADRESFAQVV